MSFPFFDSKPTFLLALAALACGPGEGKSEMPSLTSVVNTSEKELPSASTEPEQAPTANQPQVDQANADKLWQAAEKIPQDPAAWNAAASALAAAAEIETDAAKRTKLLRGALAGWERADSLAPPTPKVDPNPRPLPPRESERVWVLEQLASLLEDDDVDISRVAYRHARIQWNYGHYEKAIPMLETIIAKTPTAPEAEYAATLLLDSLLLRQEYRELQKHVEAMLRNAALLKERQRLRQTLLRLRHQAAKERVRELVDGRNYSECARSLLALHKRDRKVPGFQGDELLYNASVCQERAGQIPATIKTLRRLVKLYPGSPMAAKSRQRADALQAGR